jgi:hypothetical protein
MLLLSDEWSGAKFTSQLLSLEVEEVAVVASTGFDRR